jgi:uncharacterized membrane protein
MFPKNCLRRTIDFMRSRRKVLSLLMSAFFITVTATTTAAFAQTGKCSFQKLNFPPPANRLPSPRALNDAGAIVGTYFGGNTGHGFLLYQGKVTSFMFPGSTITEAWDISRTGIIVGTFNVNGVAGTLAFMVKNGVFHQITFPGFVVTNASAFGVNANGDVVGRIVANGAAFGFRAISLCIFVLRRADSVLRRFRFLGLQCIREFAFSDAASL